MPRALKVARGMIPPEVELALVKQKDFPFRSVRALMPEPAFV
jgi:hypothetical protein